MQQLQFTEQFPLFLISTRIDAAAAAGDVL
jgi:hypothetical protein